MKSILSAVIGATLALSAIEAGADGTPGERQVSLTIETDSLAAALDKWAQQSGFQIFMQDWEAAKKLPAKALKGTFTAQDALEQLLSGSSLTYVWISDKAVSIRKNSAKTIPTASQRTSSEGRAGIAVAKFSGDGVDKKTIAYAAAESGGAPTPERVPTVRSIDEVIVTGSRLSRRGEGPAPVTVLDRKRIGELGVTTVSDLMNYIPEQPYTRGEFYYGASGAQFAEMRGLGVDSTLVLINGRRTVPSAPNITNNAFDLNTIPLAAVDRVEVLSDSASAVYGADAVGGVINIILKDEIPLSTIDVQYGSAQGGADERRVSLSSGYAGNRGHVSVILDYFERGALFGDERDRTRNQDFRRFGGADFRSTTTNPGNISSLDGGNLPGLDASLAAVPDGSSGVGLSPADFIATSGQQNRQSLLSYWSVVPESERRSVGVFADVMLGENTSIFVEALYADRKTVQTTDPSSLFFAVVPETNPYNPFGVPVFADFLFESVGPRRAETESELLRGVLGARGSISEWAWELSVLRTDEDSSSVLKNSIDIGRAFGALAESDPAQALNVFQDGSGGSAALLQSLMADPQRNEYESGGTQASITMRGSPLSIGTGRLEMALGGEWRQEDILFRDFLFVEHDRDVSAAFAEVRVPLLEPEKLVITLAGRYDHYSDFGGTLNPQFGFTWRPIDSLLVRASRGRSFRPPSLFELYAPKERFPVFMVDPSRNNEAVSADIITGGNTELDPIEARSFSGGLVFAPQSLPGLRISATYWEVEQEKRVAFFPHELVLAHEDQYPERVLRAASTPADVAAGLPGVLTAVDISRINFGRLDTSGIDLSASYGIETAFGSFTPSISATWIGDYTTVDLPDQPSAQRVDVASSQGTITRWRGVATISWSKNALAVSATGRYTHGYQDASVFDPRPTGREIGSQLLLDIQASLDMSRTGSQNSWWTKGLRIAGGVSNLLDEEPEFSEIGFNFGFDLSQGDLRQRFAYLKVSKDF